MTKWILRTPHHLADSLSIDKDEIQNVLEEHKGLFRKSRSLSKNSHSPMYGLQLRHARQWLPTDQDDEDAVKAPLDTEDLYALLRLVSDRASEESRGRTALKAAWIAAIVSVFAALANIIVTVGFAGHVFSIVPTHNTTQ